MFLADSLADHGRPLDPADAEILGPAAARAAAAFLAGLGNVETPLVALPAQARALGLGALHVKDEGRRLGLGSFKALGGGYAVARLVLEEAGRRLGRTLDVADLDRPEVRAIAAAVSYRSVPATRSTARPSFARDAGTASESDSVPPSTTMRVGFRRSTCARTESASVVDASSSGPSPAAAAGAPASASG